MNYLIPAKRVGRPLFNFLRDKRLMSFEKPLYLATPIPEPNYLNRDVTLLFQPQYIGALDGDPAPFKILITLGLRPCCDYGLISQGFIHK